MFARIFFVAAWFLATAPVFAGQNVVVVLDDSGSMRDWMRSDRRTSKIEAAKQALLTVMEELPSDVQVGVVVLNGGAGASHWIVRLGPLDRQQFQGAIQRIRADGGTPLGEFLKTGADALLEQREKERYGTYKLLVVTDGEANDQQLVDGFLPDILSRGIVVDVIGVDMRQDHSLATLVQTYRRADDPQSLRRAISEVVLGESTTDAGDAGESDFELLAEFPDEVATAALSALAGQGNDPIREKPAFVSAGEGAQGASARFSFSSGRSGGGGGIGGVLRFLTGMCCVGCISVIVLVTVVVMATSRRRRR